MLVTQNSIFIWIIRAANNFYLLRLISLKHPLKASFLINFNVIFIIFNLIFIFLN